MKLLVTLLYEGQNRERIPLYRRWVEYYTALQPLLQWDKLLFLDNASSIETLAEVRSFAPDADIMSFSQRMERTGQHDYPYCWRGLSFIQAASRYYNPERMLCIDPDFFLLTPPSVTAVNSFSNGWYSFWCPSFNCPALECSWIHGTGFDLLQRYQVGDPFARHEQMEFALPVTSIRCLNGDRYGEQGITAIDPSWDYIGLLNELSIEPKFQSENIK